MKPSALTEGDLVRLDSFTLEMLTDKMSLTVTPGPSYVYDSTGHLSGTEVAVVLDLKCVPRIGLHSEYDIYIRLLAPTCVGWIHADYVEKVE